MGLIEGSAILDDAASHRFWRRRNTDEPVRGPLAAAQFIEGLVMEHHGPERLRAFTVRIPKQLTEADASSLIAIAKRHGWRGFRRDPETDQYDTLTFINKAAP